MLFSLTITEQNLQDLFIIFDAGFLFLKVKQLKPFCPYRYFRLTHTYTWPAVASLTINYCLICHRLCDSLEGAKSTKIHFVRHVWCFFKKWAIAGLFSFIFGLFQTNNPIFTINWCEKCPSSIWWWNSNSWYLEHESPPLTTRPCLLLISSVCWTPSCGRCTVDWAVASDNAGHGFESRPRQCDRIFNYYLRINSFVDLTWLFNSSIVYIGVVWDTSLV